MINISFYLSILSFWETIYFWRNFYRFWL